MILSINAFVGDASYYAYTKTVTLQALDTSVCQQGFINKHSFIMNFGKLNKVVLLTLS